MLNNISHSLQPSRGSVNFIWAQLYTVVNSLHLFFRRFHRFRRVLLFFFRRGLPFGFFPIHTWLFRGCLILCKRGRTSSINELERIMTQHQQLCSGLEPRGGHIGFSGKTTTIPERSRPASSDCPS